MKLVVISDIHGSLKYTQKAIEILNKEEGDYLLILGDILYHGPRNPLPEEYNPKEVAEVLNKYRHKIIAIRGNCDSEVDQMLLDFPCMGDYSIILYNNKRLFLTHGHIYNENNMPNISEGDIMLHGHTHILGFSRKDDISIINPGSIAYPKQDNPHSYGLIDGDIFYIKTLEGTIIKEIILI
jgi:putative phosphoesterase